MSAELRDEIQHVLNRHSRENRSDTPDFLLAEFVLDSLDAFDRVVRMRESWYGRGKDETVPAPPLQLVHNEPLQMHPPAPEEALLPGAPSRDDELTEHRDRLQQREEPGEYVDVEQDRESTVDFGWDENTSIGTAFGEAVGMASMCWSETPTGVFDSERAGDIVNELVRFLTLMPGGPRLLSSHRPASLGIVEDRTPEQLAADGDSYPTGDPDAD